MGDPGHDGSVESDPRRFGRRETLLLAGAGLASATAMPAVAQEGNETDGGGNETAGGGNETAGGNETEGGGGGGGGTQTVELVDYAYEPGTESPLQIQPGTTVNFVWVTDNHNIVVDSQPDGAGWEGHEPIENSPFEYEHTFETEGTYEFHCTPHVSLGMEGTIEVTQDAGGGGGGGGEAGPAKLVPDEALTLLIATIVGLVAVLSLSYVFMKYGGTASE